MKSSGASRDAWFYLLAAACGIGAGWADVEVDDLLFTALLVVMACMLLGTLRPRRPWRWVLMVGVFIPLTEFAAYLGLTVKPTRAQIYGSFLVVSSRRCGRVWRVGHSNRSRQLEAAKIGTLGLPPLFETLSPLWRLRAPPGIG